MTSGKGVRAIFARVPKTYQLVNHVLTFGFDILWRKKAVRTAVTAGGERWLDICSGTGETSRYLARSAQTGVKVFAADFSLPMLSEAKRQSEGLGIGFTIGDIRSLPYPDDCFDLITISFATRNIDTTREALVTSFKELRRILKPGGLFVNLETSQPGPGFIRKLFHLYIRLCVKAVGAALSGSKAGYAYLAHTIPRFYTTEELSEILNESGFTEVTFDPMLFGIAAVHRCRA